MILRLHVLNYNMDHAPLNVSIGFEIDVFASVIKGIGIMLSNWVSVITLCHYSCPLQCCVTEMSICKPRFRLHNCRFHNCQPKLIWVGETHWHPDPAPNEQDWKIMIVSHILRSV